MSVQTLLTHLGSLGVQLSANGDKLRCRAPEGVMTPELKARLADSKAEILELLHAGQARPSIARAGADLQSRGTLSSAEQRYWALEQISASKGAYNMALPYSLRGSLDTVALQRSIEQVVKRHQVLRSRFPGTDAGPARRLDAPVPVLEEIDLRAGNGDRQVHVDRVLWGPFDLAAGPLLRFAVLHEAAGQSTLLLSIHHLVFDGASFQLFCADLAGFYGNLTGYDSPPPPALSIQYPDYALWEQERLAGTWPDSELTYWKQHLEPLPRALDLHGANPVPAPGSRHGARQDFVVSAEVMSEVRLLARQQSASVYMVMLGVFDILLWQLGAQREFVLGVPVSNRNHPELDALIGNFTNTLALRQCVDEQESFTELLQRVRDITLDAWQHRELPIEILMAHLRLEQNSQASRLLSVMFDLQETSLVAFKLPGLETTGVRTEKGATALDLSLVLVTEEERLQGAIEYDTAKFQRSEIEALAEHFGDLLRAVLSDPARPLCQLPHLRAIPPLSPQNFASTATESNAQSDFVAARNNLEFHLVKLWEDLLDCTDVGIHDNFFELGGHSLLALRLTQRVEEMTGKRLSIDFLWLEEPTVERLADTLSRGNSVPDWRRAVPIQPGRGRAPLFVVHTMAGHLYRYYELARSLAHDQPVYGLNARGVYGDEQPQACIEDIAADCITSMRAVQPEGPYHMAGECMAGTIAYEMACQLTEQGQAVGFVGLLESYARGVRARHPLRAFIYELRAYENLYTVQEGIYHYILNRLGLQQRRKFSKLSEAQRWAQWSYKPRDYGGTVDIFAAVPSQSGCGDATLNWGQLANLALRTHTMPGDHGSMMESPNVQSVAQAVQACLPEVPAGSGHAAPQ